MIRVSSKQSANFGESTFYLEARRFTELSLNALKNNEYFKSWIYTLPARINYLADAIFNVVMVFIALAKILAGSLYSIYTWGRETTLLNTSTRELYNYFNNTLSSIYGTLLTEKGLTLRKHNNVQDLIVAITFVTLSCLFLMGVKQFVNFKSFLPTSLLKIPAPGWKL